MKVLARLYTPVFNYQASDSPKLTIAVRHDYESQDCEREPR